MCLPSVLFYSVSSLLSIVNVDSLAYKHREIFLDSSPDSTSRVHHQATICHRLAARHSLQHVRFSSLVLYIVLGKNRYD